ncbi:MAG: class I SAM-dependent methyltransferase [Ornithinimicrobium sp.]
MGAADFYTGIVTDVYGALRGTVFDADRYVAFVRRVGQPALELGCGDDGPFFELSRQGIDIEGVDSSADMLHRAQDGADAENLRIVTHCQPMEALELPRKYRAIYLAGPTFNLLPDDETAQQALHRIAAHLLPGGQVMVPLWIPPATPPQDFGQTKEARTIDGSTARYTIESESYDQTMRTRQTHTRYELIRHDIHEQIRRDWVIHWHTPDSFATLASMAGLEVCKTTPIVNGEYTVYLQLH